MGPDDNLLAHGQCFRCKDLAVVNRAVIAHLPGLLTRAASLIELLGQNHRDDYDEGLITDLRAAAILWEMEPID